MLRLLLSVWFYWVNTKVWSEFHVNGCIGNTFSLTCWTLVLVPHIGLWVLLVGCHDNSVHTVKAEDPGRENKNLTHSHSFITPKPSRPALITAQGKPGNSTFWRFTETTSSASPRVRRKSASHLRCIKVSRLLTILGLVVFSLWGLNMLQCETCLFVFLNVGSEYQ